MTAVADPRAMPHVPNRLVTRRGAGLSRLGLRLIEIHKRQAEAVVARPRGWITGTGNRGAPQNIDGFFR